VTAGCLNYSLLLALDARPELRDVRYSYSLLLGCVIDELGMPGLASRGTSDLALGRRKVSGNAQRRGRKTLLHHGTFLYNFDVRQIAQYIHEPVRQPAYREGRPHAAFVANLTTDAESIKKALVRVFESISGTTACHRPAFTGGHRSG
jgi:lipoate-protein ligase A